MKISRFTVLMLFFFLVSVQVFSQQLMKDEIVVIGGEKFILHQVRTGETVYSVSKNYKVDSSALLQHNPAISAGLKIGDVLKIPFREDANFSQNPVFLKGDPTRFDIHIIDSRKETPYFIAKKYGVTIEEIYSYNPEIRNFKKGTKIRIPRWDTKSIKTVEKTVDENDFGERNTGNFFEHIIESGETMYGLTRKYGVSEKEIKALNPALETRFPTGLSIKIPVKGMEKTLAKPVNEDAFQKHTVEKGETLYGLAVKYNLTIPELISYNPALENRNLVIGEIVLIPKRTDREIGRFMEERVNIQGKLPKDYYKVEIPKDIPEGCRPGVFKSPGKNKWTVALFLPLFLDDIEALNKQPDTLVQTEAINRFLAYQDTLIEIEKTENFLQFYEGVLLAVDSMQRAGMRIKLNIFDTRRSANAIRKVIYSEDFLETDLIIGPVYQEVQNEVAEIAAKNRIPIVSPLASQSSIISGNPYFFQVNPTREDLALKTAELVAEEYFSSNFIVFRAGNSTEPPEEKVVSLIHEKLYNTGLMSLPKGVSFRYFDFKKEGPSGIRNILSMEKENVIYIPSTNEGELSVAISNINNLAGEFPITLIGSNRYPQFKSIELDHFHNLKLKYIAPYWMDYNKPSTTRFVEKFKNNFYTEPDNFGSQGYDVAFYFLNALKNYGKDFEECLPYMRVDLSQGNYHFAKVSQFGGYINQGVSVISYERDYNVVRKRVKGLPTVAQK